MISICMSCTRLGALVPRSACCLILLDCVYTLLQDVLIVLQTTKFNIIMSKITCL